MKIITMYELLGMVKDGKAPKRIKYNDYEYQYHDKEHGYCRSGYDCTYICLNTDYCLFNSLNDTVEILEEEKKIPEKLNITYEKNCKNNYKWKCEGYNISTPQKLIADKVNSIIDYLKSKGE